jgi:hypothetical protein
MDNRSTQIIWNRGRRLASAWTALAAMVIALPAARADNAVNVTVALDDSTLQVGETTTLRVYAQVDGAARAQAERIFSWYIDLLNSNGTVATADYDKLTMDASDSPDGSEPTASRGTDDGAHRRGIHNTLLDAGTGTGVATAVELLAVEVTAASVGQATFGVLAGTSVTLAHDFIVAQDGGGMFTGGTYDLASATLTVTDPAPSDLSGLNLSLRMIGGVPRIEFNPVAGMRHSVEFSDTLQPGTWTPLAGAPHDSGSLDDTSAGGDRNRFYRIKVERP